MGRFDTHAFARLLQRLTVAQGVGQCLPYPDMTPIPPGFDAFAHHDAASAGLAWDDVCPAYALALITRGSYGLPRDEQDMEVLWDELGGNSTQLWDDVRPVVSRAWTWLGQNVTPEPSERESAQASG